MYAESESATLNVDRFKDYSDVTLPYFWKARPPTRTRHIKAVRLRPFLVPAADENLAVQGAELLLEQPSPAPQVIKHQVIKQRMACSQPEGWMKKGWSLSNKGLQSHVAQTSLILHEPPERVRSESLPVLPRVPLARPKPERLAKLVMAWKAKQPAPFRMGHVVEVQEDFSVTSMSIQVGARGRIKHVSGDGSLGVEFEHQATVIQLPKRFSSNLDVKILTHKVELVDNFGQCTKDYVHCALWCDHCDGFCDIVCQDGRKASHVHMDFLRQLPLEQFSDEIIEATSEVKEKDLHVPPAGYLRPGIGKVEETRPEFPAVHQPAFKPVVTPVSVASQEALLRPYIETGAPLCPFIETQEGGLNSFVSLCTGVLTNKDTIFDIGCGTGKILGRLLQKHTCNGVGVEINPSLARKAEQQLARYVDRAKVVVDDVRNVDLRDATFVTSYFLSHSFTCEGFSLREHLSKSLQPGCVILNYTYEIPGWIGTHSKGVYKYVIGQHLPEAVK